MENNLNGRVGEEQNVYSDVYRLLIAGMIGSTVFFVVGLILALLHPHYFPLTTAWVRQQYRWNTIRHGLASGDPTAYFLIATVFLILTPVLRVIVSIYAFLADGDRKYVAVTSVVLAIMALTVVLGLFGMQ
jgi:uncharacterized membrane protein